MHRHRVDCRAFVILALSRILAVLALMLCAGLLLSCKSKSGTQVGNLRMSDAELRYGMAPTRNSKVVYQDDVILVGHGAEDVRSVSSDGLTWTINEHADHAEELQPGKIMFITSRGVGRVLGVERNQDGLGIILGPVALTDVVKEAQMSFDQPVDLSQMIAYTAPDLPGTSVKAFAVPAFPAEPDAASRAVKYDDSMMQQIAEGMSGDSLLARPRLLPAALTGPVSRTAPLPKLGVPNPIDVGPFNVVPFCCGGLGLKIVHEQNGLRIMAYAVLRLKAPALHFNLDIRGGKVRTAELELKGVAGLTMQFEASSALGVNGNINQHVTVPVDFSLPIGGLGLPLALTLHQAFVLDTAFSARNSTLNATGDYAMDGSLFMGYHDGAWGAGAPTKFIVRQSLLDSINGLSLGANGLVMAYEGKLIVGIGAFGFVTGPYFGYRVGIGTARGSDAAGFPMGLPVCHSADLDIGVSVGIGYSIPQPVTNVLNFILRNLNVKAIDGFGGIEHRESLIKQHGSIPDKCG